MEESTLSNDPVSYHKAWEKLCISDGVLVPGGFGKRGIEGKVAACRWCREKKKPFLGMHFFFFFPPFIEKNAEYFYRLFFVKFFIYSLSLGICLGLQVAVIEFARNVLKKEDANSTEVNPDTTNPVIIDMPEHNAGQMGGTMRLGKRKTVFVVENSILSKY